MGSSPTTPTPRWQVFTAAPHRVMFFAGALQTALVMLLWLAELLGRAALWWPVLPMVLPSTLVHTFLMLYGVFPFFIFGFLLTVYPRWMSGPLVPATRYLATFIFLTGGMLLFYAGLFISKWLLVLALATQLTGWGVGLFSLLAVFRQAPNRGAHEKLLNLALLAAMLGMLGYLHGVWTGSAISFFVARELGLWLFLVPVVFTVGHRMIPFFSGSALANYAVQRPSWSLPLLGIGVIGHVTLETLGYSQWLLLFDTPLLFMGLHHTRLWNFRRSFEVRLLAMLHIAFLWFGIAMALYVAQSFFLLASHAFVLGRAPLHALGIGFVTSMVVAMASRVTLGHSGQPLAADPLTWRVLLGINVTACLRLLSEFTPVSVSHTLNILAAMAWLICLLPWIARYVPAYLRPRIDGKPG